MIETSVIATKAERESIAAPGISAGDGKVFSPGAKAKKVASRAVRGIFSGD
jgi:hypothetical protein